MTICIHHEGGIFYTDGSLVEVAKAINEGTVLKCWWSNGAGRRFEEDVLFYGDPVLIRTESDV